MTHEHQTEALLATLHRIAVRHVSPVLASSFGAEDMVLTDLIARHALPIRVITLDTGRLPAETYALIDRVREHYQLSVDVFYPDHHAIESFVREHGVDAFYHGVELRKQCCAIRKSAPLKRALAGSGAWVSGLRRAQSPTRTELLLEEFDQVRGMWKFNPLAEWSDADVWQYVRAHSVPYNPLHDRGYPSIGCAPCTRAIEPGEDIRAGRWWWEQSEHKECGIHPRPPTVAVRVRLQELRHE